MDSLNAIEKCFASLRDKLFDERLAKLDAELAMLAEPNVTHPELLAMNQVLEQRRDEKIQHENTLLKYKLGSLQTKSKAEKAQVHGQYMQSVRDIRDQNMEQVNKECHQIHKERRNRENDVPEYMYHFHTRRSQQITHQAAYNKEVSLLSGVAKYCGFPAAPEISGAKPSEIESDFEKMGIVVPQPSVPVARHPPSLRTSLSASAVLQRSKSATDEHFLEQNPWANPQHPVHLHRQPPALSRTGSPPATSAAQKRPSAGLRLTTIVAEPSSGRSVEANSAIDQREKDGQINSHGSTVRYGHGACSSTPSRHTQVSKESQTPRPETLQARLQTNKSSSLTEPEKAFALIGGGKAVQEIHVRPYMPRVSCKADSLHHVGSASVPRGSAVPSGRFPMIKAEDIPCLPGSSPTPQHYHQAVSVGVNGGVDRFAAS
ncbi:MAG: hypothetical protein Q9223_000473 [Gallowayella weberi]